MTVFINQRENQSAHDLCLNVSGLYTYTKHCTRAVLQTQARYVQAFQYGHRNQHWNAIMHNIIETPFALLAGLLTIASPCVLPVLPILLGSSVGTNGSAPNRSRPLFIIAGFILSFSAFAMLLGTVSSTIHVAQEVLRNTAIALLALSGLLRLWPRPYEWLVAQLQPSLQRMHAAPRKPKVHAGSTGGFVLGMSLGAVWTPCAGPVLASILVLVVKAQDLGWSALLLLMYAIGAAIPMLAILYGGQYITRHVRVLSRHTQRLQQLFGVLVMLTALAMYFQYDVLITAAFSSLFSS